MTEEMKIEKNEGRGRKIVAGTLVGLGVLGLGMAAATQLNLGWNGNFQAGTTSVQADCQPVGQDILVSYDEPIFAGSNDTPWTIEKVNFANVADTCLGMKYDVAYKVDGSSNWVEGETGVVGSNTISASLADVEDIQEVTDFALTIYGE